MHPRSSSISAEEVPRPAPSLALAGLALLRRKLTDYLLLTRARLALLVLVTGVVSFWLASGAHPELGRLAGFALGTFLVIAGANAFNQIAEREQDAEMSRTAGRPLPAGRMSLGEAWSAALALSGGGLVSLLLVTNPLTVVLAAAALLIYVLAYTPLKRRTDWSTLVGAVSGAVPPLMGWSAATGNIGPAALGLFAILFLWQFPHTWAIAAFYRDDFTRVGYRVLPLVDTSGRRTRRQAVVCGASLVGASLLPTALGVAGSAYLLGALLLDLFFVAYLARFARERSRQAGGRLLAASLLYLPLLLALLALDTRSPLA